MWVRSLGQEIPWRGNGNPLQYSCLGNQVDREAWGATAHGVTEESDLRTKQQKITIPSPECFTGEFCLTSKTGVSSFT